MKNRTRFVLIFTVLLGLLLACGPFSSVTSPGSSSNAGPVITSTPLTPNPLNVQITLDTAHAQTSLGYTGFLGMPGPDGNYPFQLTFPAQMVSVEADGTLVPVSGAPVTITPVTAIEGIPFSQGFLKAVDLSPQGLLMVEPAILKLTLPGEYDPTTLVGFSSDGSGNNFHLFPAAIYVVPLSGGYGGFTEVTFNIMHFSVYGVAEATTQEISDQHARIPEGEQAQNEDLLSPLVPLDQQTINRLTFEYDNQVGPAIDRLISMEGDCNQVDAVAQQFIAWHAEVAGRGAENQFTDEVNRGTAVLLPRLIQCMGPLCSLCMQKPVGSKQQTDSFLIHAYYAEQISKIAGDYSGAASWRKLTNICQQNAGRPMLDPPIARGEGLGGPDPTPIPCPTAQP